jgi:hypothetical protein
VAVGELEVREGWVGGWEVQGVERARVGVTGVLAVVVGWVGAWVPMELLAGVAILEVVAYEEEGLEAWVALQLPPKQRGGCPKPGKWRPLMGCYLSQHTDMKH